MQSSLLETPQDENRINSAQAVCSICKSHVNLNIFMDHLDRCSAKMLEEDENERAMGDICNSTENHCNDKVSSYLEMFPLIDKERIEDMVKRNTSTEEVADLLVNENLENITSEKGNADLISINNLQYVWK